MQWPKKLPNFYTPMASRFKKLFPLKPRNSVLGNFYVFDVETGEQKDDGSIHWHLNARPESFRFGVIYGRDYSKTIYTVAEFIETLKEPRFKKSIVFAHNAVYDLTTLFGNIFDLDSHAVFVGSRFIKASNGVCTFADSMNIVRASVARLGKMLGVEKPTLGNDALISPNGITSDEINRCYTDCYIVWHVLFEIFSFAGNIKITQAGLAMNYYRAFHQPYIIEANENTKYFWESYFGGRTEAFKLGSTRAHVIDVNSMYPFVMRNTEFPNPRHLTVSNRVSKAELMSLMKTCAGLAYCTVNHAPNWFGYLPVKHDGKLCFPVGRFSGCWNFNELLFAVESGLVTIEKIDKVVSAPRMPSPFVGFVDTLYKLRQESKHALEIHRIKIFLNSLYGKFAQRIDEETIYIKDIRKQCDVITDYQARGLLKSIDLFNHGRFDCFITVRRLEVLEPSFSIPSFASYVTSSARVVLLKKLKEMEQQGVVYCDTDSIFFERGTVESSVELGGWKLENKIVTEIRGLKNYSAIEEDGKPFDRIKGIPGKAKQIAPNTFEYYNLLQTKEALRRGLLPGVLTRREKFLSLMYDKRIVNDDGTTKPILL